MVSTRGVKFKFCEGEKVLCYEPDLTKAKVLYDSKVLEVNDLKKDSRGRRLVEYLIHFQGWNSSWDRYVCEDYVLKDVEENRQLQRDLAEKAQLQLGAYLYRRERTKRRHQPSETGVDELDPKRLREGETDGDELASSDNASSCSHDSQRDRIEDGSDEEGSPQAGSYDGGGEAEEGDEDDDPDDDDKVPLQLSDTMKRILELDYDLIKNKNKLVKLPAEPNVVSILQGYVKHYAMNQLCGSTVDVSSSRPQPLANMTVQDMDEARRVLNICKEMVDGVRIYFDFTLKGLLLYNQECGQFETHRDMPAKQTDKHNQTNVYENGFMHDSRQYIKQELDEDSFAGVTDDNYQASNSHLYGNGDDEEFGSPKRRLRSYRCDPSGDSLPHLSNGYGKSHPLPTRGDEDPEDNYPLATFKHDMSCNNPVSSSTIASTSSRCSSPAGQGGINSIAGVMAVSSGPRTNSLLNQILAWQLVPDSMCDEVPAKPSLVYGAIHLARLFVKLPKLLYELNMPEKKLKVLFQELDLFLNYLEDHSDWFGESFYKDSGVSCT